MAELDIARIKRNVSKMIAQDAPEADIDAYVASEGATPELLRGGVSAKTDAAPAAAPDKGESLPRTLIGAGAGLASMVGGIGETAKLVGAQGVGDKLSQWSEYIAPEGYVSSREKLKQGDITALPRTAAELAPSVGLDLAAMKVGGAAGSAFGAKGRAIGSILGALGSVYGQSLGSDVKETAQENKHDTATAGDIAQGAGTTTAKALINLLGLKAGIASKGTIASTGTKGVLDSAGQLLKRGSVESASNVAQDAVGQLGTTAASEEGPRIKDPASLLASGLTGGAVGAGFSLPRATRDVAGALRERNTDPDAAARVSNRAVQHAGSVDALSNTRTSFDAYSRVKADINTELGEAAKNASLSTDAQNAVNAARSGKALNKTDLAHIDSANDPALSDLARDANEVTRVTSRGNFGRNDKFEGGVTSAAKKVILQHPILAINKLGGVGTGLAGYAAPSAIGPAAATLAGLWALGRGADYMTGARSPGRSYAEKFADGTTSVRMPAAAAPAQQPTAGARPTGPIVAPVPQPWGPIPAAPQPAPGLATPPAGFQTLLNAAVTTINKQGKQQNKQTILQAMPLLQALAAQNSPKQQASIEKQGAGIDAGIADIVRNRPAPPLALPPPQAAIPMGAPAQQLALPAPSRAQLPAVIPQRAPATIRLPEAPQPEPARAPLPDVIPLPGEPAAAPEPIAAVPSKQAQEVYRLSALAKQIADLHNEEVRRARVQAALSKAPASKPTVAKAAPPAPAPVAVEEPKKTAPAIVEALKAAEEPIAVKQPAAPDDGLGIPDFLKRTKSNGIMAEALAQKSPVEAAIADAGPESHPLYDKDYKKTADSIIKAWSEEKQLQPFPHIAQGITNRIEKKYKAAAAVAKEVPGVDVDKLTSQMLKAIRPADAELVRNHWKRTVPSAAEALNKHFSDEFISDVFGRAKKKPKAK